MARVNIGVSFIVMWSDILTGIFPISFLSHLLMTTLCLTAQVGHLLALKGDSESASSLAGLLLGRIRMAGESCGGTAVSEIGLFVFGGGRQNNSHGRKTKWKMEADKDSPGLGWADLTTASSRVERAKKGKYWTWKRMGILRSVPMDYKLNTFDFFGDEQHKFEFSVVIWVAILCLSRWLVSRLNHMGCWVVLYFYL